MRHNKILSLTVALHLSQFSSDLYAFINGVSAFLRLSLNKLSYYIMVREPHILLVLLLFPVNLVSFNAHNQLIPKHLTLSSTWDSSTNFFSSVWGYLSSCVTSWKNFFSWKFETFATKEIWKTKTVKFRASTISTDAPHVNQFNFQVYYSARMVSIWAEMLIAE